MDDPRDTCPCGKPAELHLGGLPVCLECFHDADRADGSIMPGQGALVVRRGDEYRRIIREEPPKLRPP